MPRQERVECRGRYAFPQRRALELLLQSCGGAKPNGFALEERLAVHRRFEHWLRPRPAAAVAARRSRMAASGCA
jgi:hypothetical protein